MTLEERAFIGYILSKKRHIIQRVHMKVLIISKVKTILGFFSEPIGASSKAAARGKKTPSMRQSHA
jgi:hypothetical protein